MRSVPVRRELTSEHAAIRGANHDVQFVGAPADGRLEASLKKRPSKGAQNTSFAMPSASHSAIADTSPPPRGFGTAI